MAENYTNELKEIDLKLEQIGNTIENINTEKDKLINKSKKLQTVMADQDTSQKEIYPIVQNYTSKSDSNNYEKDQVETEYNGWKTKIILTAQDPLCNARENSDEYMKFLGDKVHSLERIDKVDTKTDPLFTWEDIDTSEAELPDNIKNFLIWNFDVNLEWIAENSVEIVRQGDNITISDQNKSKEIKFELENLKVILTLDDGRTAKFIAEKNGTKHDIHFKSIQYMENEYNTALRNKIAKAEQFTKLKNKQKLIDDLVKKCKESIKFIEDESKKGADKNIDYMKFYLAELKRDKDKLINEVGVNSDTFETSLNTALNNLKPKMRDLGDIEVEQTMLKSELATTKTKLDEAIKNRNSKILKQFTK